ncbi:MAG: DNA cytosine methyltransferase [Bacteroidales bacterium]|nr:DNA cytosine methyltransferase [Bacteroidales bacterium]
MTHASLFSGIGGFDLAAEWAGWTNLFNCEIDPFCKRVLKYHFPNAIQYNDIKTTDFTIWRGKVDVLTGGFPCQPFSQAGKRKGTEDDRHLWPEMLRAIKEIQPGWVVGENVFGITNWSGGLVFEQVQADLEAAGYEVQPFIIPACAVNAPHRRDRVWFVAKNTMRGGQLQREPDEKGTGIWEQRDTCTGGTDGVCLSEGTITHTVNGGHRADGGQEREKDGISELNRTAVCTGMPVGTDTGIITDPDLNGFERGNCKHEINPGEGGVNALNDTEQIVTPNPQCGRHAGKKHRQTQSGKHTQNDPGRWWSNFPTQPPVRERNDGFSDRLDGITFSKWRNKSIKSYGNAIVPQVVFQIFKVIELMILDHAK